MVSNLKNLKTEIDCRLSAGGLSDLSCCQLQNAQTILNDCIVTSVPNIDSLPNPILNEGRFVYIEDIKEYRYSDQIWTDNLCSGKRVYQNQIFSWGNNACGALAIGLGLVCQNICSPVREFCSAADWCQVNVGAQPSVAIKTSGQIWAWGRNFCGALGDGTITDRCSPVREICSATDWCQVSTSFAHVSAIKTSGELWGWGNNGAGRIGDGCSSFPINRCSPVREICSATDWCQVGAGCYHTAAVKTTGELWAWGSGTCGRLGDGTITARCSPVREFCSATDWCQASTYCITTAIKTDGTLWVWGTGRCGVLGNGITLNICSPVREFCSATDWCQVSAGRLHTAAVKTSGEIWSWGCASSGQLGNGTISASCSPVREFCSATDWCQVSAGGIFTGAVKTSGELWAWGSGGNGELGNGTATSRCSPVREFCSATDWCQVSAGCNRMAAINGYQKGFFE